MSGVGGKTVVAMTHLELAVGQVVTVGVGRSVEMLVRGISDDIWEASTLKADSGLIVPLSRVTKAAITLSSCLIEE